ncbi:MAG: hypothetical protein NVSMB6_20490 [Burkholderiaceae bacterium]
MRKQLEENMTLSLGVAGIFFSILASMAQATVVQGGFQGVITGGYGSQQGADLASVKGTIITGAFTFDTSALQIESGSSGLSTYSYAPIIPLQLVETIGAFTFTILGNAQSIINIIKFPDPFPGIPGVTDLNITALAYDPTTLVINMASFSVLNALGNPFLLDPNDLGSLNFSLDSSNGFITALAVPTSARQGMLMRPRDMILI